MSYKITMNGASFCSSSAEYTAVLDPKVKLEVNKAGTLTFTMLPDHPMYDQIALRQSIFDVYQNDELIFEGVAMQEDTDFYNRKTVTCEGELTFLNDTIQRQARYTNMTCQSLLAAYLNVHNSQADAGHEFSVGAVTVDGGNSILRNTNFQSTMKEIGEDLIDNYGGYLRVRHSGSTRYLDYLAESPRTSSQVIRIGKNLMDLSSNLSSLNIITVLIPRGAKIEGEEDVQGLEKRVDIKSVNNGRDYLVGTAQSWYGSIWGTQTWDGVTVPANLKTKGQEYLDETQWANLVINASAIDLGLTDEDVEQFRLLDMIRVVSEPHGIDRQFLLSALEINLDHPSETLITLGKDARLSLSARSVKNTTQIEAAETRILANASENARQILDSATDGNIYFKYDERGKCYEIDIMDTNDPSTAQRIWRWNIGGWGYSNDGGQTYITAATMDGTIFANMIKAGILSSDNGKFSLDMETGTANMASANITGGSININTDNQTMDYIRLNHTKSSAYIASNMFNVENMATADNPYLRSSLQGGGLFMSNTDTGNLLASINTTSGSGTLYLRDSAGTVRASVEGIGNFSLYDSSGVLRLSINNTTFRMRDSNGVIRAETSSNGLTFYDSSGNETGGCSPNFKILTGLGNAGQVGANSYTDYSVQFSSEFAVTPDVFPALYSAPDSSQPAHINMVAYDITKTGFTLRVFNGNSAAVFAPFKWIAISK